MERMQGEEAADCTALEELDVDGEPKLLAPCEFCRIPNHRKRCKFNKASVTTTNPQAYSFCILNDVVFDHILSFLSNQTLTKLQLVTGEHYPTCEPRLATLCCACENDNPVMFDHVCRQCELKRENYQSHVSKAVAKEQYGVKNIRNIPCEEDRTRNTLYDRVELEKHMLKVCGSKLAWLRVIAKLTEQRRKGDAAKQAKKAEKRAFFESLAPGFASYVDSISWKETDKTKIERASSRFIALSAALEERGLRLRADSHTCKEFIASGWGNTGAIVDTMEEMNFLNAHTDYSRLSQQRINALQTEWGEWLPSEVSRELILACREKTKAQLCVQYLLDNKGLKLPRKWELCRARFEGVKASGIDPMLRLSGIYL